MKKIIDFIRKLLGGSTEPKDSSQGFTLVELIIVIAILGILAAAVLAAIDPIDKINAGNDTKVQNNVRSIYDGAIRYYSSNNVFPTNIAAIVNSGELRNTPTQPTGYSTYKYVVNGSSDVSVCGQVKSKAQLGKVSGNPSAPAASGYIYASNGKICYRTTCNTTYYSCP